MMSIGDLQIPSSICIGQPRGCGAHYLEFGWFVMGKKSKRHTSTPGGQKATGGDVLTNKAVCKVVDELWESMKSA